MVETAADARALLTDWRGVDRPLAIAADDTGPFSGLAIVVDPSMADVVWILARVCCSSRRCARCW